MPLERPVELVVLGGVHENERGGVFHRVPEKRGCDRSGPGISCFEFVASQHPSPSTPVGCLLKAGFLDGDSIV